MRQASPILILTFAFGTVAGCAPEERNLRLDDSAARAGLEAAASALRAGDCRLMVIHSHFDSVPLATEKEFERVNAGQAALKDYNGPHLLQLKSAEDEALNAVGYAYAKAYNGHVLEHRARTRCEAPEPTDSAQRS